MSFEGILVGADMVLVGAAFRIKTGMQIRIHFEEVENNDLFGEEAVELQYQTLALFYGEVFFGVEVGIVGRGVHAGVGAPAARDRHTFFMKQQRQAVLQRFLYGRMLRLNLPAEKCGSVVCHMDKVTHVLPKSGRKSTNFPDNLPTL